jgi:hypothetical protein
MIKSFFFNLWLILSVQTVFSQIIDLPVVNAKSHKTLVIDKIDRNEKQIVFYLSVTNELTTGDAWFCADKQIYIKDSKGDLMYFITRSEGIPICPETHKFTKAGEVLQFVLYFPPISPEIKELDLIENCSDNCFSFNGIILDPKENDEIKLFEKGVELFSDKNQAQALPCFLQIVQSTTDKKSNIYAYSMYIIPLIYFQIGDTEKAKIKFLELKNSQIKDRQYFIEKLQTEPFFKDLK